MKDPNSNFFDIQQRARDYFAANPDTTEDGGLSEYQRWEWFWQARIAKANSPRGKFTYASDAMLAFQANPICTTSTTLGSNWLPILGPIKQPTSGANSLGFTQNMGVIISVAPDPHNSDIVYAGSGASGLWKSTTIGGVRTWNNITYILHLPLMGVQDIAIDPDPLMVDAFGNANIIYAATGGGKTIGYGSGIIKSTDGGLTQSYNNFLNAATQDLFPIKDFNSSNPNDYYLNTGLGSNEEGFISRLDLGVIYSVGIQQNAVSQSSLIYPNPTQNYITIKTDKIEMTQIEIQTVEGKSLALKKINSNSETIDVSHLASGIYLLKIKTKEGTTVHKFIKE
jgi:hypothetical protein